MSNTILKLVDRIAQQTLAHERLQVKCDELRDERDRLHNQVVTNDPVLLKMRDSIKSKDIAIGRLKDENDKLNLAAKEMSHMLKSVCVQKKITDSDIKDIMTLCENAGYPIEEELPL